MPDRMMAIRKVAREPGLQVEEVAVPAVGPRDVLVRIEAASICGTDLHIWNWDPWSQQRIKPPLIVGHELAGTIVETGPDVRHVRAGDYVSAESHVTCGMCFQCRTGQAHMCVNTRILGVDRDGCFAEYAALPEEIIWQNDRRKLPPHLACLQEPFGNAVFATLAHDLAGQTVGVFGCGPIGCFSIGIAKASGAAAVFAVDIVDHRLDLAKAMGADAVHNAREDGDRTVNWMVEANDGFGVDIVLEMSGAASAITSAFRAVRNGGRMTLFGIPPRPVEIDVAENMIFKNLTVLAINGRKIFETWYKTRWLLESGVVRLDPLVSAQMPFERIDEAMELLASGQACKIVLRPPGAATEELPAATRPQADPNIRGRIRHP